MTKRKEEITSTNLVYKIREEMMKFATHNAPLSTDQALLINQIIRDLFAELDARLVKGDIFPSQWLTKVGAIVPAQSRAGCGHYAYASSELCRNPKCANYVGNAQHKIR